MQYTIELYTKRKNFRRDTYFVKQDITDQVIMPIIDVQRLDRTLDTSSISLLNDKHKPIRPFSRVIIRIDYGNGKTENIYRIVHDDNVEIYSYGKIVYKHNLNLIEPTKLLERYIVDNTTVTNLLAFLYDDTPGLIVSDSVVNVYLGIPTVNGYIKTSGYTNDNRYKDKYYQNSTIKTDVGFSITGEYKTLFGLIPVPVQLAQIEYKIVTPSGQEVIINSGDTTYQFTEIGVYKIIRNYYFKNSEAEISATATWTTVVYEAQTIASKQPTRYTIKEVINRILGKVAYNSSAPRENLDDRLFYLDPNLDFLENKLSPEFTFTQNTLFGILEQIGNSIHAIPRLIPTPNGEDDYSLWTTITFDFLGGDNKNDLTDYDIVATEYELHGDNYTSAFVSNVENSFQTNNVDYISLNEPFSNGYVSTRTEDGNFEISNDHAVIKTSRPIQRIISLKVGIKAINSETDVPYVKKIDISRYVKEQNDYLLLSDYARTSTDIANLSTKSTAIYYTRGDNVIRGLDYYPPQKLNISYLSAQRTIETIINIETTKPILSTKYELKDLMFQIEYVPFYSFKGKQYKELIDDDTDSNELFYNQQDSQSVDIESYGENMRGALLMTANVERTETGFVAEWNNESLSDKTQIKAGDLLDGYYYAYQVNREFIANNQIKTTAILSKNFNKWNDYVAIKKNYREYEISNRESVETNPIVNEFCIISDMDERERLIIENPGMPLQMVNQIMQQYGIELSTQKGFLTLPSAENIKVAFVNDNTKCKPIEWAVVKTETEQQEFDGTSSTITRNFVLPCASFTMGNAVILNFSTQDNYAVGTKSEVQPNGNYTLENYVPYGNKYGDVDKAYVSIGNDNPYSKETLEIDIDKYSGYETQSKNLYSFNPNWFDRTNEVVNYYDEYPFIINKDSRQKLDFTIQLNYVTDKPWIWISPNLAKYSGFVGNQKECNLKIVLFKKTPDRYLENEIKEEDVAGYMEFTGEIPTYFTGISLMNLGNATENCVGFGIVRTESNVVNGIDKTDKLLIYYNRGFNKNEELPNLYLMVRRKI